MPPELREESLKLLAGLVAAPVEGEDDFGRSLFRVEGAAGAGGGSSATLLFLPSVTTTEFPPALKAMGSCLKGGRTETGGCPEGEVPGRMAAGPDAVLLGAVREEEGMSAVACFSDSIDTLLDGGGVEGAAGLLGTVAARVGAKLETVGGFSGKRGRTRTGVSPTCSTRSKRPAPAARIGSSRTATLCTSVRETRAIRSTPKPLLTTAPLLKVILLMTFDWA